MPAASSLRSTRKSSCDKALGWLAKLVIDDDQLRAEAPRPLVSPGFDDAEDFYQHTPASRSHGVDGGVYNLWGQVPVQGDAHYFNLDGRRCHT